MLIVAVCLTSCSSLETVGVANTCSFEIEVASDYGVPSANTPASESTERRLGDPWVTVQPAGRTVLRQMFDDSSILVRRTASSAVTSVPPAKMHLTKPLPVAGKRYADLEFAISPLMCADLGS